MRFYSLILVSIIGLSPIPGNAGTLVGDWYQDDPSSDSINDRRAFSQPATQSTDTSQVTLGIQSPGSMDLVEFYLVISNEPALSNCLYTVYEIAIDSRYYALRSTTDSSNLFHLTTRSKTEQKQLWRDFKKGQILTLKNTSGVRLPGCAKQRGQYICFLVDR